MAAAKIGRCGDGWTPGESSEVAWDTEHPMDAAEGCGEMAAAMRQVPYEMLWLRSPKPCHHVESGTTEMHCKVAFWVADGVLSPLAAHCFCMQMAAQGVLGLNRTLWLSVNSQEDSPTILTDYNITLFRTVQFYACFFRNKPHCVQQCLHPVMCALNCNLHQTLL